MQKNGTKSVRNKPKKKPTPKRTPPSKKSKTPPKLNKKNLDKLYISVRNNGNIAEAPEIFGIGRTTVHSWKNRYKVFSDTISHAMADHKTLTTSEHPEFFIQAMHNIEILLNDRVMRDVTTKRKIITPVRDDELDLEADELKVAKGEKIVLIEEDITIRKFIREPTWFALEKVLGKKELRHIVYSKIKNGSTVQGIALINSQFNNWILNDNLKKEWNGSLLNDVLDLLMIRALQAETRQLYENGELPFETYSTIILNTTKNYGYIAHNRESRALKLLEGKSFAEILDTVKAQLQNWMNTVEAVCNDVSIERTLIPSEIHKRIKDDKQVQGYTLWAEQGKK